MYEGHEGPVNQVVQVFQEEIITGSWDGTAKIWDVETGKCKQTLEGHSHAVTVYGFENGIVLTGSQDKKIRFWFKGNLEKEIMGHEDIVRGFTEVPGVGFASCSNDELVKIWTTDGLPIAKLTGHQGYVFHIGTLATGEIISSSDDKSVRIWDVNA